MDIVLEVLDTFVLDRLYAKLLPAFPQEATKTTAPHGTFSSVRQTPTGGFSYSPASKHLSFEPSDFIHMSQWPRDNIYRQGISLYFITLIFGFLIYFVVATLSYYIVYDKSALQHPKYLKGQIRKEIKQTVESVPFIALLTAPIFLSEVRGYSKLYDIGDAGAPGLWYEFVQFPFFILFTDFFIYWIHRGLHLPMIYKRLHKPHHKWVVPTPFASHAFHPLDGFSQGVPYHVFPFLFPLNKFAYIALFTFVNLWTVTIHDGEYAMNSVIINGAACHSLHHSEFLVNYGQFTTLWDRIGGSYRKPPDSLFDKEQKMSKKEWERQAKAAEQMIIETEGVDDRHYIDGSDAKKLQ